MEEKIHVAHLRQHGDLPLLARHWCLDSNHRQRCVSFLLFDPLIILSKISFFVIIYNKWMWRGRRNEKERKKGSK